MVFQNRANTGSRRIRAGRVLMRVAANGIELECEVHGDAAGRPLLLIMGLGMQLTAWPDELLKALVAKGFRPITFDNRDVGLSSRMEAAGVPNMLVAGMMNALGLPVRSSYLLADMARDAAGLLDALQVERCDVVGVSMGGMIAQEFAALEPQRVRSLSLIMTSSGARRLAGPTARARRALLSRPRDPGDVESRIDHAVSIWRVIGSPGYPVDDAALRERVGRSVRRSYYPHGVMRQLVAVAASGDRTPRLGGLKMPTLVLHGRDDPLVPVACGMDLAGKIPDAQLDIIDGMGHDLPPGLIPRIADGIAANCDRVA